MRGSPTLILVTCLVTGLVTGAILLGLAQPLGAAGPPPDKRPSVLLITLDTTRADRLGCYGHKGGLTPSLDEFSKRATLFESCETAIPQTMPAHATLLSGLQPNRHGVRKNLEVLMPKGIPSLPEEFAARGYRTAAFVSAYVLLGRYGMSRGFSLYDDSFYDPQTKTVERPAGETLQLALKWISEQQGPWFCWVHLFDPHDPYDPPEPFASKHKGNPYDGEIAAMDHELGRFLAALGKSGVLDQSLVVVCGDHGEALGDHGEKTHGIFLYEATTHVPLLVHLPGQAEPRRVGASVGLVDIAPTLRDVCDLKAVAPCDGVSLAPALRGGAAPADRGIYLESLEGLYSFGWAPLYARVEGRWKYILAPRAELYDLKADRIEATNILAGNREQAQKMKIALSTELGRDLVAPLQETRLDSQELASLKSLGYIAGTPGKAGASYADPKDGVKNLPELELGRKYLETGRYAEAAPIYEKLWAKDGRSAQVALLLATCYQDTDPAKALRFAKESIRLRPDFPHAHQRALTILINQGSFVEAKKLAALSIKETQDSDGTLGALGGWAAFMAGAPESEVTAFLDRSVRAGEENFMAMKLRAVLAQKRGDTNAALAQVRRFVVAAPPEEVAKLKVDPLFQELRQEPEFWKILLAHPLGR